jgi:drug/metabolite transporter (DMT)-like permease
MKQLLALVAVFALIIGGALFVALRAFTDIDTQMSWHGWFAMGLGVVLTAALGGGLMYLVFYSARNGHDDIDHDI